MRIDSADAAYGPRLRHGHSRGGRRSATYESWAAMHARCGQPSHEAFRRYGGRGVHVCARWSGRHGFTRFLADMGERPAGKTLDRFPDKDGNYEPGNCRWATPVEQQNNVATNHRLTVNGETLTITEWARRTGLKKTTIRMRLVSGWPPDRAVNAPPMTRQQCGASASHPPRTTTETP